MTKSPWAPNPLSELINEAMAAANLSDEQSDKFHSHVVTSLVALAQILDDERPRLNIFQGMTISERLAQSYGRAVGLALAALCPEETHMPGLSILQQAFKEGVKESLRGALADGIIFSMKDRSK